jgi:hypothetical protein
MQVKLFIKDDCPKCPAAKHACENVDGVEVFDVGDIDGLAEAAFHGVLATPTVLVVDSCGTEVAAWRGEAPQRRELLDAIAQ